MAAWVPLGADARCGLSVASAASLFRSSGADSVRPSAAPRPAAWKASSARSSLRSVVDLLLRGFPAPFAHQTISYEHRLNIREGDPLRTLVRSVFPEKAARRPIAAAAQTSTRSARPAAAAGEADEDPEWPLFADIVL